MAVQLANATVTINNDVIAIVPNSLKYTEGLGEQTMRATSAGGGQVEPVYSENIESNLSDVMFELAATVENIELARSWKVNGNQNLVQISGNTPEGRVTRSISQAAILNNYEVELGSDTNITCEFKGAPAV